MPGSRDAPETRHGYSPATGRCGTRPERSVSPTSRRRSGPATTWPDFHAATAVSQNTLNNWKKKQVGKSDLLVEVCRRLDRWPEELGLPKRRARWSSRFSSVRDGNHGKRDYSGLQPCLCPSEAFVADRTADFVGREFVFDAIDKFCGRTLPATSSSRESLASASRRSRHDWSRSAAASTISTSPCRASTPRETS